MAMTNVKIIKCDEPTKFSGWVYPRTEVEAAIKKYMAADSKRYGMLEPNLSNQISLENISHEVLNLYVDNEGWLVADIDIKENFPRGKYILSFLNNPATKDLLRLSISGIGNNANGVISNYTINYTYWTFNNPDNYQSKNI